MGFLSRLLYVLGAPVHKGRDNYQPALYEGRSPLWDNTNTPGHGTYNRPSVETSNQAWQTENYFNPLPNPEPYLDTADSISPFRVHAPWRHLQPNEPVREPGVSQATYINTAVPAPGSPPSQVEQTPKKRSYAPTQVRQRGVDKTGDNPYDAGDFRTLQKMYFSGTPSQVYFDTRIPLPEFTTPSYFANQVEVPEVVSQTGWQQAFVYEPGMRDNEIGVSHPTLQSRPINVNTLQTVSPGARKPVKVEAPKVKKTTGR
jgi:hypothetical protein